MKCSSRRNCNWLDYNNVLDVFECLNEVQFPKELQPTATPIDHTDQISLNEVQFPKELQQVLRELNPPYEGWPQ